MKKRILIPIVSFIFLLACHQHSAPQKKVSKADLDIAYNNGSGIKSISLDSEKIHTLTNMGMLWGFLKYYHASVNKGNYNMDAELFRVLPKVLAANNGDEENKILEQWVDHFGMPDTCKGCKVTEWPCCTKLAPDYGCLFDKNNFPLSLIKKLEFIRDNRDTGWEHYYIEMAPYVGNPIFMHETAYDKTTYPDAGVRLLALYRFWNMIRYFHPDRHLTGADWNKILAKFIPLFCNATDALTYQLACAQLIASLHDTHAQLYGTYEIEKMKGDYYSPFKAGFVEHKLVVTGYYSDSLVMGQVRPGDIIEQIDGVPVDSLIKKYLPLTSASNYTEQLYLLCGTGGFLFRGHVPDMRLLIVRDHLPIIVTAKRSSDQVDYTSRAEEMQPTIIAGNIGYIYAATLNEGSLDSIKRRFKDTKGIIIDMRCYPGTFMPYTYGSWLKRNRSAFVVTTVLSINIPGWFGEVDTLYNGGGIGDHYNGKLVIIVNEKTLSQAEFTTMALCTVPGALVVGDTTAGADGNVSGITLPGGLATQISGLGELYPDGGETQRIGVRIDHFIAPTIAGIKAGCDEQLEYAIKWINSK